LATPAAGTPAAGDQRRVDERLRRLDQPPGDIDRAGNAMRISISRPPAPQFGRPLAALMANPAWQAGLRSAPIAAPEARYAAIFGDCRGVLAEMQISA